jgi:chitinase
MIGKISRFKLMIYSFIVLLSLGISSRNLTSDPFKSILHPRFNVKNEDDRSVLLLPFPNYADGNCSDEESMTVNLGYYESWAMYRSIGCNPVSPEDIDVDGNRYTHLVYSFASINSRFELEPWAGNYDSEVSQYLQFNALKETYPTLKTLIAVGGASFNNPGPTLTRFSNTAKTAARRKKFALSCVKFCKTYNFNGVDIDWEYPGDPERGGNPKIDKRNFVLLIEAIRSAFDNSNEDLQLTMAVPVSSLILDLGYDLSGLAKGIDFFNLMTYDIHGDWDIPKITGANTDMPFIFDAVQYFLDAGVSSNQMTLGLAAYGRTYKLAKKSCKTVGCRFVNGGPGGCAGESGYMPYFTIQEYVDSGNYESLNYNANTGSMELVLQGNIWISFDSLDTFQLKYTFASQSCFRGIMWWAVDLLQDALILDV